MRISTETERRVVQVARELNYRPYLVAGSLRGHSTRTIGLISDTVATDVFAGQIIRGCLTTAVLNDHLLFVGESEGAPRLERELIRSMQDRGVSGFLYACMYTRKVTIGADLHDHPLVLVNCRSRNYPTAEVIPDERGGGRSAAAVLLAAGHTDGVYLVGETPTAVFAARQRRLGIEETLTAAGHRLAGAVHCTWWPDPAYTAVTDFLRNRADGTTDPVPPTAFICLNDRVALGTYQALEQAALTVPGQVSVVSFDDSDLAGWMRPGLTSVGLPHFELGRAATEMLLDPNRKPGTRYIPMPLNQGASVDVPHRPIRRRPHRQGPGKPGQAGA
jgi:LacI family transcriptional regulator